jgi:hypothetical protein
MTRIANLFATRGTFRLTTLKLAPSTSITEMDNLISGVLTHRLSAIISVSTDGQTRVGAYDDPLHFVPLRIPRCLRVMLLDDHNLAAFNTGNYANFYVALYFINL